MKKLTLIALFFVLLAFNVNGQVAERSYYKNNPGIKKTAMYDSTTNVWTDVFCTIGLHKSAVHDGRMNFIRYDSTLGSSEQWYIVFHAPASDWSHLTWDFTVPQASQVNFYYNPTITLGDQITPTNPRIGYSILSENAVYLPASISDFGTQLDYGGFVSAGKNSGGVASPEEEIIVNGGATILIELCSLASSNNTTMKLYWHNTPDGFFP